MSETRFVLDHVLIAAGPGAPETDTLAELGFHEGPPNTHPGQGTACRRVFFRNAYLELAWVEDPVAVSSPLIERTGLAARLDGAKDASRVGVAARPVPGGDPTPPVPTWPYSPPYLPDGWAIHMARSSTVLHEPLLFFMPGERHWAAPRLPHPNGARVVTAVTLTLPSRRDPSPALDWLARSGCVRTRTGETEGVAIELDRGARGRAASLAPALPLTIAW